MKLQEVDTFAPLIRRGLSINPEQDAALRLQRRRIELTKKRFRSKILLRLKTQKEETRERKSQVIKKKLFHTQLFKQAKIVMFYIAFDGEVNTKEMIQEAKKQGKVIAVPVCRENKIYIRPCLLKDKAKLVRGPYGVCEPAVKTAIKLEDLDLVIVPGVAFDRKNNRLGRGKGCYDRFLQRLPKRIKSIGLAYNFQIFPNIPVTKTDWKLNRVIFA